MKLKWNAIIGLKRKRRKKIKLRRKSKNIKNGRKTKV
jgi:hypothetical protein